MASARAAGPIATAGLILAGSSVLLAIVPLATFRAAVLGAPILGVFLVRWPLVAPR